MKETLIGSGGSINKLLNVIEDQETYVYLYDLTIFVLKFINLQAKLPVGTQSRSILMLFLPLEVYLNAMK
jgi:hypothetical protein